MGKKYTAYFYCAECDTKVPPYDDYEGRYGKHDCCEPDDQLFCPKCGCNVFQAFSKKFEEY